VGSRRNHSHS